MTLTPDEIAMCKRLGLDPSHVAAQKEKQAQCRRDGRLPAITTQKDWNRASPENIHHGLPRRIPLETGRR
jgi:hypothetical protein